MQTFAKLLLAIIAQIVWKYSNVFCLLKSSHIMLLDIISVERIIVLFSFKQSITTVVTEEKIFKLHAKKMTKTPSPVIHLCKNEFNTSEILK